MQNSIKPLFQEDIHSSRYNRIVSWLFALLFMAIVLVWAPFNIIIRFCICLPFIIVPLHIGRQSLYTAVSIQGLELNCIGLFKNEVTIIPINEIVSWTRIIRYNLRSMYFTWDMDNKGRQYPCTYTANGAGEALLLELMDESYVLIETKKKNDFINALSSIKVVED